MTQLFFASYLTAVLGLVAIVNPLGMAPIFLSYTEGTSNRMRARLAARIAIYGFVIIAVSMFAGSHFLNFFGLTISAVQIGGGGVVVLSGWTLLHHGADNRRRQAQESLSDEAVLSDSFYPLTLPLTVGPGAISVALTLGARDMSAEEPLLSLAGSLTGGVSLSLIVYLCFRFAEPVFRRLGQTGSDIVLRLSAFVLLCIGVQIVWNGIMGGLALPR